MKLLIHHPRLSYYLGGGEIVPLQQAAILSQLGHDVTILTAKPIAYSTLYNQFRHQNRQIKVHEILLSPSQRKIYTEEATMDWTRWDKEAIYFGQKAQSFYFENKDSYDLVITHLLSDSIFIPESFTNVLHLHGVPVEYRSFDDIFLDRPNRFIAVSGSIKEGWMSLYPKLENKDIEINYNGINLNEFTFSNDIRDIDLLYVGRLFAYKGIYNILDALTILLKMGIAFNKLVMVGDGPELDNLKNRIKDLDLTDKVELYHNVDESVLQDYYHRSKVFLCPSSNYEGVLTTMMEAAASGCAIVTSNCCGMIEFARHEHTALLAKPNKPDKLAAMIQKLLQDTNLRSTLVNNAFTQVKQSWDMRKNVEMLVQLYESYVK